MFIIVLVLTPWLILPIQILKRILTIFVPSIKPGLPLDYYEGISLRPTKRNTEGMLPVKFFGVEEMASFVIANLKQKAEEQLKGYADNVVLGRPVEFSSDPQKDKLAQNRLGEAARLAGFESIQFVLELIAAALYYERYRPNSKSRNVFIFDFGCGTLDTCILELRPSERITPNSLNSRVLASQGILLGGNDLDKDVFARRYLNFFGKNVKWGEKKASHACSYIYRNFRMAFSRSTKKK